MRIEHPLDGDSIMSLNVHVSDEEKLNLSDSDNVENLSDNMKDYNVERIDSENEYQESVDKDRGKDLDYDLDSDEDLRKQLSGLKDRVRDLFSSNQLPDSVLEYEGHLFQLFPKEGTKGSYEREVVIEDTSLIHIEFNLFISGIRKFLEGKYGILHLSSKEIFVEFPDLNLQLNEDNIYVKRVTMNDIISIFTCLRENSIRQQEKDIPDMLRAVVVLRPRFVSRYNDLVEIMDNSGSFSTAKGFSNDETHPVLVDEVGPSANQTKKSQIFVMDSDEPSNDEVDSDIEILN